MRFTVLLEKYKETALAQIRSLYETKLRQAAAERDRYWAAMRLVQQAQQGLGEEPGLRPVQCSITIGCVPHSITPGIPRNHAFRVPWDISMTLAGPFFTNSCHFG